MSKNKLNQYFRYKEVLGNFHVKNQIEQGKIEKFLITSQDLRQTLMGPRRTLTVPLTTLPTTPLATTFGELGR